MKQDVIISIRHEFAEKIYSSEKLYEFRKRIPNIEVGTRCWIYEPLPTGKVTGFFIYGGCYRDEKAKVWELCKEAAGISRETFMQYYKNNSYAHAWLVGNFSRCPRFDLKDVGINQSPQSYIKWSSKYLDNKALIIHPFDHMANDKHEMKCKNCKHWHKDKNSSNMEDDATWGECDINEWGSYGSDCICTDFENRHWQ